MSGFRELVDKVLGYDDNYQSTPASRFAYDANWSCFRARPDWVLQLQGTHVILRPAGNEGENVVQKIVAKTLERMTTRTD